MMFFAFLIGFFAGLRSLTAPADDGVGGVLGLAETRAPAVSHRLAARRRYFYVARGRGTGG